MFGIFCDSLGPSTVIVLLKPPELHLQAGVWSSDGIFGLDILEQLIKNGSFYSTFTTEISDIWSRSRLTAN